MHRKFAVIGLGLLGKTVAESLAKQGAEVMAIDVDEDKVNQLRDTVAHPVTLDAKDLNALESQMIHEMDSVIVTIGEDFESMLLCTANLLDLGVKRIIARAMNRTQRAILEKMGVDEIISPEIEMGGTLAEKLVNPDIITFFQLPDNYEIVELKTPKNVANRTLADLELRRRYNLNLVTIKREVEEDIDGEVKKEEHIVGVPKAETVLFETDTLILMGKKKDVQRFIEVNN